MNIHGTGLYFSAVQGGGDLIWVGGSEIADTNWHHIALCKIADEYAIYKDGVQINYTQNAATDAIASA